MINARWVLLTLPFPLLAAGYLIGSRGAESTQARALSSTSSESKLNEDAEAKLDHALRRIRRLEVEQRDLTRAQRSAATEGKEQAGEARVPEAASDSQADENEVGRAAAELQATYERFDERLATEPYDDTWRAEQERSLGTAAAALSTETSKHMKTECAGSLCKTTFEHPNQQRADQEFVMSLIRDGAFGKMQSVFRYGSGETQVYSLRPGHFRADEDDAVQ